MRIQYDSFGAERMAFAVENDGRVIRKFNQPFAWTKAFVWGVAARIRGRL